MERCAMPGCVENCAGRYAEPCVTRRCAEPFYTERSNAAGCEGPYVAPNYRAAECACYPNGREICCGNECDLTAAEYLPITMGYVPRQFWCNTYDTQTALRRGSLFPEMDKPFLGSRGVRYDR